MNLFKLYMRYMPKQMLFQLLKYADANKMGNQVRKNTLQCLNNLANTLGSWCGGVGWGVCSYLLTQSKIRLCPPVHCHWQT